MTFRSILFGSEDGPREETLDAPNFFVDLNLDQIVDAITADKEEYNLKPFFYSPLRDPDTIRYRQEIMRDLENNLLFGHIQSFSERMHSMREHLALVDKAYYKYEKQRWFLDAVEVYCDAVSCLVRELSDLDLKSRGFLAFREYLTGYACSERFRSLVKATKELQGDLTSLRYCVLIKGYNVTVRKYESERDYSAEVEETFRRFKQETVKDYRIKFETALDMNHVEAKILDRVSQFYPYVFSNLDNYYAKNGNYLDRTVRVFDREIQFYIVTLQHIARFRQAGLKFCYPQVSNSKEVYDYEGFDLALADKLIPGHTSLRVVYRGGSRERRREPASVVCNDFYLKDPERIFVVSGPNQGGKTTFARTFGQLHYLASLGCPVPGREARLFLFDRLFTHFEKEENITDLRGKLEDDLIRIRGILNQAGSNGIIIINEIFTSTTSKDASFLSKKIIHNITQLDSLCVCVTFIDELASLNEKTVSMVSTVVPENPALRTFKILRRPADGLAHAISIAEKYRVTTVCLEERIQA
jgi:DNA mismatch repair protein MutS